MDIVLIFLIFGFSLLTIIFGAYYLLREHIKLTQTLVNKITPLLEVGNSPVDMPAPEQQNTYTPEETDSVPLDHFTPKNGVKVKFVDKNEITPMEDPN